MLDGALMAVILNQSILGLSSRTETGGKAEPTGKRFSELQK